MCSTTQINLFFSLSGDFSSSSGRQIYLANAVRSEIEMDCYCIDLKQDLGGYLQNMAEVEFNIRNYVFISV